MPRKRVADMTAEERDAQRAADRARYAADPGPRRASALRHLRSLTGEKLAAKRARQAAWNRAHPHVGRAAKLRMHGLTLDDYDRMLAEQGHRCAICGTPAAPGERLHVDHDHETSEVRGLLCGPCNRGLGLYKDSPALLANAINYLERNQSVRAPGNL